jgi:hypothetical protein
MSPNSGAYQHALAKSEHQAEPGLVHHAQLSPAHASGLARRLESMAEGGDLVSQWIDRLDEGWVDLSTGLDRFPELGDAVVPVGFGIAVEDDSHLAVVDGEIQGLLRARLIPPGVSSAATPPTAGAIGLELDTGVGLRRDRDAGYRHESPAARPWAPDHGRHRRSR